LGDRSAGHIRRSEASLYLGPPALTKTYNWEIDAMSGGETAKATFVMAAWLLTASTPLSAEERISHITFEEPPVSDSDAARTLQSLKKLQGTGQFCQDGLYLMTHFGDRAALFEQENQRTIDNPLINQTWRHCSLFASANEGSVVMGRNWDNQTVGSIIVSLYHPPNGYASVSFGRSIDLGFGHKDLTAIEASPFSSQLLLAPFYAMDGMNEHGLAVGVAAVRQVTVKPRPDKKLVFITYLMRKILDQAKSVDEAVDLAEQFVPFDLDQTSLNCHLMIADSSGESVILEYVHDRWHAIRTDKPWQVLTTKPIYHVSDARLRHQCWRYRSISAALEAVTGNTDWPAAMKILRDVEQKGTTWSVVYSLAEKELHFSVYQQWENVYHLDAF
jgi:hypothetical protein